MFKTQTQFFGITAFFLAQIITFSVAQMGWASEWVKFPENFQWCVATSAHQVEGNNQNSDWWAWEQQEGRIKNGDRSGLACDHWNRVSEDIRILSDLGVKSYRLSIEWAKIEPSENQIDEEAIRHYAAEIQQLEAAGIQPIITLHHFTFPSWVAQRGGWEWPGVQYAFTRFAEIAYTRIAPHNLYWVTVNEPLIHVMEGYLHGSFPPGEKRSMQNAMNVFKGLLRTHAQTYHRLHELAHLSGNPISIGFAHNLHGFSPANPLNPLDRLGASIASQAFNWMIPNAVTTGQLKFRYYPWVYLNETIEGLAGSQDFFGMNYYSSDLIQFSLTQGFTALTRPESLKTDLHWEVYPAGIYDILKEVKERYSPSSVLILENGAADAKDSLRPNFIKDHLFQISRAIQDGVPVQGYCHWSLMDNFEWAEGFWPRFGLYEMDYATLQRKPRPSADLYREIILKNGFNY